MLEPLGLPFFQRGLLEVLLLAVGAGVLGTWIVLRGLAFYAHAVGTATFPGLVLAEGLGFSVALGAFATAMVAAGLVTWLTRRRADSADGAVALVLCGALVVGIVLASDVFAGRGGVDTLLFGSLLAIDASDVLLAGAVAVLVLAASHVLGARWLAAGFDPAAARAQGLRSPVPDVVLLGLVALAAVAALSAVGGLLATALLVVPAATTRLFARRMGAWQLATVALAACEGAGGLWLSFQTDAPPGSTIAVLAGTVFALAAVVRALRSRGARPAAAAVAVALLVAGAAGCGSGDEGAGDTVRVVATTTQLGDLARQVGGDAVTVTQLLQPNADPHDYEPRPDDVAAVAEADVVLVSGLGLDGWHEEVVRSAGGDPAVVDVGEGVPHRLRDPHWWHDPRNAAAAAGAIARALGDARPGARAAARARARDLRERLAEVDAATRRCLAAVPAARRRLVTDHDAFGHLAERYDIDVVGAVIPSRTTQAQPSAGELARLSRVIRAEGVEAVFPESSVSPRLARALARQTGARVGGALYADTLGPAGSRGATVLQAAAANADTLVRGFTGGARGCPIRGL